MVGRASNRISMSARRDRCAEKGDSSALDYEQKSSFSFMPHAQTEESEHPESQPNRLIEQFELGP
jgi:hypothetical protein